MLQSNPDQREARTRDPSSKKHPDTTQDRNLDESSQYMLVRWNDLGSICVEPGTLGLENSTALCGNRNGRTTARYPKSIKLKKGEAVMLTMQMNEPRARPKATLFTADRNAERDTFYKACGTTLYYYCHVLTITSWRGDVKVYNKSGFSLPT